MAPEDFETTSPGRLVETPHGCCAFVPNRLPHGILVEVTGNYRNRLYLARPITSLMS